MSPTSNCNIECCGLLPLWVNSEGLFRFKESYWLRYDNKVDHVINYRVYLPRYRTLGSF